MSGDSSSDESAKRGDEGQRFARRMYLPRMVGLALGAVCVGGGFYEQGAPAWMWAAMLASLLGWPHLARALALRSRNPYRAELRNLVVDNAWGGIWIAAMHFNPAPSVVMLAMLSMDKAGIGGLKMLARCLAALVVAAIAVALVFGIEPQLMQSGIVARLSAVPLLIIYPIMVGLTAHQLARQVRLQNLQLTALSNTDGLTALPNHTAWQEAVEREYARARRGGQKAAVLMIDLDHFKQINDNYGHPAGDAVLRELAAILRESLRGHDMPGRYGGEEFGVLLPGSDGPGAEVIAERIRKRIEQASFGAERALHVTTSIGCAALEPGDASAAAWIARADRALYLAKAAGRNRSVREQIGTA